jgi:hypothetical protein
VLASVVETAASIAALASPVGSETSGTTVDVSGEEAATSLAGLLGVDFGHHSDRLRAPQGFRLRSSVLLEFVGCYWSVQEMADNQEDSHPQRGK